MGICVQVELVTPAFILTSERLVGGQAAQVHLEFFKSLEDVRAAGLQDLARERPTSETAGVSRQTNQAHLRLFKSFETV